MKAVKQGALLGRCTICSHKIHDTPLWLNKTAVTMNGKHVCGSCLKDMRVATGVASRAYTKMLGEEPIKIEDRVTESGLYVDAVTGKIKRKEKA